MLEATAPKPGNVHPGADFPDLSHDDLMAAAVAIAAAIDRSPHDRLGRVILEAVSASRRVTRSNANLGMILAIAPLAAVPATAWDCFDPARITSAVRDRLAALTAADAADIYGAIAIASPGGMGTTQRFDVAGPPPREILAAMRFAAPRDQIARLWTAGFESLFEGAVRDIAAALEAGLDWREAVVEGFLLQLAREPDTLIARRHGAATAAEVSAGAGAVLSAPADCRERALADFDRSLRAPRRLNPGTTADLVAAALYILLMQAVRSRSEGAMEERYEVRLRKAVHVFSAGHFITLTDEICEAVHGHNWTVGVDVSGPPDAHGMVVNFITLRDELSAIVGRLDHRMLLATENPLLSVTTVEVAAGRSEVTVRFGERRWVFPAEECLLMPVGNTSAEWIARWIGLELLRAMAASGSPITGRLRVEVDECLGQSAVWERLPN
jgi:6-pyruvoyl tetrahydropterin synthase/QueD family protein